MSTMFQEIRCHLTETARKREAAQTKPEFRYFGPKAVPLLLDGTSAYSPYREVLDPSQAELADPDNPRQQIRVRLVQQSAAEQEHFKMSGQDFTLVCRFKTTTGGTLISKTGYHPFEAFGARGVDVAEPFSYAKTWYITTKGQLNFAIGGPDIRTVQASFEDAPTQIMEGKRQGLNDGKWHVAAITYTHSENQWRQYIDLGLVDAEHEKIPDKTHKMDPYKDVSEHAVKIGYTNFNWPTAGNVRGMEGEISDFVYLENALDMKQVEKFIPFEGGPDQCLPFWELAEKWADPSNEKKIIAYKQSTTTLVQTVFGTLPEGLTFEDLERYDRLHMDAQGQNATRLGHEADRKRCTIS